MQSVSNAWKALYTQNVVPRSKVEVKIAVTGETLTFTDADIVEMSIDLFCDLCSFNLPSAKLIVKFDNSSGAWDADNASGYNPKLDQNQIVNVRIGYEIGGATEWISGGEYCLSEWQTNKKEQTATITAVDFIQAYLLPKQFSYSGLSWQTPTNLPTDGTMPSTSRYFELDEYGVQYFASNAGLPRTAGNEYRLRVGAMEYDEYLIDDDYEWKYIYPKIHSGKQPSSSDMNNYNCAQILQYVANSSCGAPTYNPYPYTDTRLFTMYLTRDGFIDLKARDWTLYDYDINAFNVYSYDISREKNVLQVDFEFSCFGAYNPPRVRTSTAVLDATGRTIKNTNPNGEQFSGSLQYGISTPGAKSAENNIGKILVNHLVVTGEFRADPRLDVGDKVTFSAGGTSYDMYVTELKYKYNGCWKANFAGRIIENGV